jgi:hypothetical protein
MRSTPNHEHRLGARYCRPRTGSTDTYTDIRAPLTDLSGYAKKFNANGDTRSGLRLGLRIATGRVNP